MMESPIERFVLRSHLGPWTQGCSQEERNATAGQSHSQNHVSQAPDGAAVDFDSTGWIQQTINTCTLAGWRVYHAVM